MLTKSIPYTFIRGGYFYFSRRVPTDLRSHYSYHRVVQGLHISSPQKARVQANIAAAKLDAYWSQMRLAKSDVIGMSLVKASSDNINTVASPSNPIPDNQHSNCPTLLDALQVYQHQKVKVVQKHSV